MISLRVKNPAQLRHSSLREIDFSFLPNWKKYGRTYNLLVIMNQTELRSGYNQTENFLYDHIRLDLTGIENLFLRVQLINIQ